jgi:preprotein translocase subunit SecA
LDDVSQKDLRVRAMAAVSIVAERTLNRLPYEVQILAALAMHEGCVVQMAAGEGKTLAVAVAAVLHGWRGLPCHVVTSNDYLAARDVELMQPLFTRCGVTVKAVVHDTPPEALAAHYAADVVYGTSKQFLADYLKDSIALKGAMDPSRRRIHHIGRGEATRMRGLYAAIVDEADNVLIDEAVTPLIISAPQPNPMLTEAVQAAHRLSADMFEGDDYIVSHEFRDVIFTKVGQEKLQQITHE